jgi:cellulose synthase/poly-beta-1,6-N-acetylglucosamine synthase-like glycosyltransferase
MTLMLNMTIKYSYKQIALSVVVTRYGESDSLVLACLDSLAMQNNVTLQVIFLDQKYSKAVEEFCENSSSEEVSLLYMQIPARSLSFARNHGIAQAETPLIAFCDADCRLPSGWAREILDSFASTNAAIVGTKIVPLWQGKIHWFHRSRIIREFYSLLDVSSGRVSIPKIVGASFALNTDKIWQDTFFDESYGRRNGLLLGGEETDLCKRVISDGGTIVYTPHTYAEHTIAIERLKLRWLVRRAFFGGLSRAMRSGAIEPYTKKKVLIDYIAIGMVILPYAAGYAWGKVKKSYV